MTVSSFSWADKTLCGSTNLSLIQITGFKNTVDHGLCREIIEKQRRIFPPSSRVTRFPDDVAERRTFSPVATDPVKLTLAQSGCAISCCAISPPAPFTTLITPSGKPASLASSATRSSVSGVYSLGLMTMVQPHTSAAASFQIAIIIEKFHGTIPTTTPMGWRWVNAVYLFSH